SRCARFADRQGRGADALGYAVQAQDYALATQIVRAHVLELPAGTSRRTWGVLGTIPLPSLARYPLLAMLLALKYNSRSHLRLKALELFGIAAAGSRLLGKSLAPADRLLLEVVESVALRVCGQLELAQGPARSALGRNRNMAPGERDRNGPGEPYCLIHLGRTFAAAGRSTEAAQALQLAAAAGLERDMAWISGSALTVLAAFEADEGNLAGAAGHLEQARAAGWAP
ncbi:hypothetical protein HER39_15775, partial [Arthrobacter deserti]|nr:hypothetical protein [Arthrobacter deserti]